MPEVVIVASTSTYRGDLNLAPAVGPDVRLLDGLNTPQRLQYGMNKPNSGLLLENPVRTDRRDGTSTPLGSKLVVQPQQIIAAYEVGESTSKGSRAVYETRVTEVAGRVVIHTSNGLRLEGGLAGGAHSLETAKNLQQFFPCTQVMLLDLAMNKEPQIIPFMAINLARIESYGQLI